MKPSPRVASFFIFLFFIFFNGLQVYLIVERISETKSKFGLACAESLVSTLTEYNKLKAIDSTLMPKHAWIVYSLEQIAVSRPDTQHVQMSTPNASLAIDTVDQATIEGVLNSPSFQSIDLDIINRMFQAALIAKKIHSAYRLDTITVPSRRIERQLLQAIWMQKRSKDYPYATRPVRIPQYARYAVYAEHQYDRAFFGSDLVWPMLAFTAILLIGNTALLFVYKTIRRQKRINEVKTDFINNITHEMKTPITIASAGLEALEHHVPPTERINFYLHTSKKQLHLLNDFVERILEAAVQDVSDFTLKKERLDLHALSRELIQSHSILPGKPVNFQLTGEEPVYLKGDRLHLQTAFHNIIDNAIKYSGESVDINIDLTQNNRECTVTIRDNGMGIPAQYIKNIFEKFFRVPQGDAQVVKGFGLGLYYVSTIIKKHSGHISVHSKPGSGTEFIITLPKYP
jgi:signal transduction histidine kinase